MPDWDNKILKHNPGEKSLNKPFTIYLDLECKLKKLQSIQNNPEKRDTEKKSQTGTFWLWSIFTRCSFDKKKINLIIIEEKIKNGKKKVKDHCHYTGKFR